MSDRLVVVTATTNPLRARACLESWGPVQILAVVNGHRPLSWSTTPDNVQWIHAEDYLGSVGAFRLGVDHALADTNASLIACLHDDVEILQKDWTTVVERHVRQHPACGLLGFGGAIGLGADDLYQTPYDPMQLARRGFRSNMTDAEVHGARSLLAERVACLDGFSQIGRREFWFGELQSSQAVEGSLMPGPTYARPWSALANLKIVHHFYDGALGCLAARYGWETWYVPVRCRHLGGQTAVADPNYQAWAKTQIEGGDHGFWVAAHKIAYDTFRDVLPLRV